MKLIIVFYYIVSVVTAADIDVYTKVDMESETLGSEFEGWTLIAHLDLKYQTDCPSPLEKIKVDGKDFCRVSSDESGCSSITYSTGTPYNRTRGLVRGYQKGTPDGFRASRDDGFRINDPYVDGISITMGNPRRHIWTYAAGLTSNGRYPNNNCPCAVTPGSNPPIFVGKNYYCSSGCPDFPERDHIYADTPLWQGTECTQGKDSCCTNVGLPWFYREFPAYQNDDIEVRICYNQAYSDEAIFIDKLLLYIG